MDALTDPAAEQLLSPEIVARRLDCNPATVAKMARDGRFIPPILVGNRLRWRERDVNGWIAARGASPKQIATAVAKSLQPQKRARRGG